jgi:hypothetical protein
MAPPKKPKANTHNISDSAQLFLETWVQGNPTFCSQDEALSFILTSISTWGSFPPGNVKTPSISSDIPVISNDIPSILTPIEPISTQIESPGDAFTDDEDWLSNPSFTEVD